MDLNVLNKDADIKKTMMCLGSDDDQKMPCADKNGIPIIRSTVLGGTECTPDTSVPCSPCQYSAKALMVTYLLNKNDYS